MRRYLALLVVAGLTVVGMLSCSPTYVLRAGWEEAKILSARRPIDEAVEDASLSPELRSKLALVREARVFAERRLGLDAGRSYREYTELERDTLVMVLSAAPELQLRWKTWWFPIVGHVPYKGYFDFEAAYREARKLEAEGYDTYVRPSAAFSTLGWLPDPVLSPALRGDAVSIAETVIHEITHTTFFPSGQARFNESFANFVGHVGAIELFCDARGDARPCQVARDRWHDVRVFGRFFQTIHEPLQELYTSGIPDSVKLQRKAAIARDAARRFRDDVKPLLRSGRYGELDPDRLDNAWLLSRLLYYSRLDDFETLYARRGDLASTVEAVIRGVESGDDEPWTVVDRLLDS